MFDEQWFKLLEGVLALLSAVLGPAFAILWKRFQAQGAQIDAIQRSVPSREEISSMRQEILDAIYNVEETVIHKVEKLEQGHVEHSVKLAVVETTLQLSPYCKTPNDKP